MGQGRGLEGEGGSGVCQDGGRVLQEEGAEEEAYDLGVAETQAALKAQVPGVCRLYCS